MKFDKRISGQAAKQQFSANHRNVGVAIGFLYPPRDDYENFRVVGSLEHEAGSHRLQYVGRFGDLPN